MTAENISEKERRIKEASEFPSIDMVNAQKTKQRLLIQSHKQQILWEDGDLNPKTETELWVDGLEQQTVWQESELTPMPEPTFTHEVYKQMIEL